MPSVLLLSFDQLLAPECWLRILAMTVQCFVLFPQGWSCDPQSPQELGPYAEDLFQDDGDCPKGSFNTEKKQQPRN